MTSANVTEFTIYNSEGESVGKHYQHAYCKPHWEDLFAFSPLDKYTIKMWGYDEEEEYWENEPMNLKEFLIRCHVKIPE
jgi:hypothetical protein